MTMSHHRPTQPSGHRVAAIVLLGPIVGSMAVVILYPPTDDVEMTLRALPFLLFFGSLFGIVPSLAAAFLYTALYPRLGEGWVRWLQCALIGALCGSLGVLPLTWIFTREFFVDPMVMGVAAIAGAVALPLTALTFRGTS